MGITKKQSSDWQSVARFDDQVFNDWLKRFLDTSQTKVDELYLSKLVDYARERPEQTETKTISNFEKYQNEIFDMVLKASVGKLSRETFIKETEKWKLGRENLEKWFHQIGELF